MKSVDQYKPGSCNIGFNEVIVRKKFFRFFLILTILLSISAFAWSHSLITWFLMLFSSFSSVVLYLEIRYRFCIIFGFFNLHNFDRLGELHDVKNPQDARKDRRRVLEIVILSLMIALCYATAIHLIAESMHGH